MRLVVDANILFAAIIKDGMTRRLLFDSTLSLYMPEFAVLEIQKHEGLLRRKAHLERLAFEHLLENILRQVTSVPELKYTGERLDIDSPDDMDAAYLTLAHHMDCPLWSNDTLLKRQADIRVLTTAEVMVTRAEKDKNKEEEK